MSNEIPRLRILLFLVPAVLLLTALAPAAQAVILLNENFNDGTADGFTTTDANWEVRGGLYRCELTGADVFSLATAGDETWRDYVAECDVRVLGSLNNVFAFRIQDEGNFYDVNIRPAPYNDIVLTKRVGNADTWHVFASHTNEIGDWHNIRVAVQGRRITVWVDGIQKIQHVDTVAPYLAGGIALVGYCGWSINYQTAWFDDVLVYDQRGKPEKSIATDTASWDEVKSLFR